MITIRELVKRAGGASAVAERCGVVVSAVSNWSARNAIPARHELAMWRMARECGAPWQPAAAEAWMDVPGTATMAPAVEPVAEQPVRQVAA